MTDESGGTALRRDGGGQTLLRLFYMNMEVKET